MGILGRLNGHFLGRVITTAVVMGICVPIYLALNNTLDPKVRLGLALDGLIPFLPWTILIYASFYFLLLAAAWACEPDEFVRLMMAALAVNFTSYLIFAVLTSHYPRPDPQLIESGLWRSVFSAVARIDAPGNTFPSIHVSVTSLVGLRMMLKPWGKAWAFWSVLVCISTLTVKQHFVVDVIGGVALALLFHWVFYRWKRLRPST